MKIIVHGGGQEVGRSCFEIQTAQSRVLLDAGLKFSEHGSIYPIGLSEEGIRKINGIFISHAHLDHTGALPLFDHMGLQCPIIATKTTEALIKVLLEDAFGIGRIHHEHLGYDQYDLEKIFKFMQKIIWHKKGTLQDIEFEFFDAGHIPGSSSIQLKAEGKTIVYTGDIRNLPSRTMNMADTAWERPDLLIIESTYGNREHEQREKIERMFLIAIEDTLKKSGSVLIPTFGVGRAQELLLVLAQRQWDVPIYIDGMAKKVTELLFDYPRALRSMAELKKAYNGVRPVKGHIQRQSLLRKTDEQGIFLTTSGMLTGGPVMEYLKSFGRNKNNSILLTGYQAENTNGRMLVEEGFCYLDGWKALIQAEVKQFDFSAHAGASDLRRIIRQANPAKVMVVHGEPESAKTLANWCMALDIPAFAPENGTIIDL